MIFNESLLNIVQHNRPLDSIRMEKMNIWRPNIHAHEMVLTDNLKLFESIL